MPIRVNAVSVITVTGVEDAGHGHITTVAATIWQRTNGVCIIHREDHLDMEYKLSSLERRILNLLQKDFPVSEQPYKDMAAELNIKEADLIQYIANMKDAGIIRRIGAIIESRTIGYYSTLCTCRVDNERVDEVAEAINEQKGVTHNYLRDQDYNLWFTLTCASEEKAREIIADLEKETGVPILSMPTEQVYKIRVALDMSENNAI